MSNQLSGKTFYSCAINPSTPNVINCVSYVFGPTSLNVYNFPISSSTLPATAPANPASPSITSTYTGTGTVYTMNNSQTLNLTTNGTELILTSPPGTMKLTTMWANSLIAAPSPSSPSPSTTPSSGSTPWKWWVWALIALAVISVVCGSLFIALNPRGVVKNYNRL